jgi:hypothetical protein
VKKPATLMQRNEQLINWPRAVGAGVAASLMMMAFMDIFCMLGVTPFSFEVYLGSLLFNASAGTHLWTIGLIANAILGGLFGIFYAYFFEDVFYESGSRRGAIVGFYHAILAAVAIFPFFAAIREFMHIRLYSDFGFFGVGLGGPTTILLLMGHLIFGATIGTFYGPVGRDRVRARWFESAA